MNLKHLIAGSLLLFGCVSANAATVFTDTFEADTAVLNKTTFVGGWTVTNGSVDVVNNFAGFPGNIVDLDGSTGDAGVFTKAVTLTAGQLYTASFGLAGSQRGTSETVGVSFGTTTQNFTVASAAPFSTLSLSFTPSTSGSFNLSFSNTGGDNVGALLDNVTVATGASAPIPEPGTVALMLAGLVGLGAKARRRKV
jgi:hypothetical protein